MPGLLRFRSLCRELLNVVGCCKVRQQPEGRPTRSALASDQKAQWDQIDRTCSTVPAVLARMYEGGLISNAHSEISRKRDHVFKQTKLGSKVQYFSYKLTYLFFDMVALSFNTFFPT